MAPKGQQVRMLNVHEYIGMEIMKSFGIETPVVRCVCGRVAGESSGESCVCVRIYVLCDGDGQTGRQLLQTDDASNRSIHHHMKKKNRARWSPPWTRRSTPT